MLAEYNVDSNNIVTLVSRFVYATRSHVPDYMIKDGNAYRIVTDQLGSVRLVVNVDAPNAAASIVQQINYDAWGVPTIVSGSTFDQPFGFAGGLWDRDTGLVHFGAREYDPVTGRWLQKEPLGFGGGDTNLYGYAGNDPVNLIDPDGTAPGDPYGSRNAAALAALQEAWAACDVTGLEFGGWLLRLPGGGWTYSPPFSSGSPEKVDFPVKPPCGAGGAYHSHPEIDRPAWSEHFSSGDRWVAHVWHLPFYLSTPSGRVLRYDPSIMPPEAFGAYIPEDVGHVVPIR